MNIDNFFIEDSEIELAKEVCSAIEDSNFRSRATTNALAAGIAKNYFADFDVDIESCLHKIPYIAEKIDIADIYVNNSYIDVRVYFDGDTIKIPKSNFSIKLLPTAYMILKVNTDFTGATVVGFITPDVVSAQKSDDKFFYITEDLLVSFYDIQELIESNYENDTPTNFEELVYNYLDNNLQDTQTFFEELINSKYSRYFLRDAAKAQEILEAVLIISNEDTNAEKIDETADIINLNTETESLEPVDDSLDLIDFNTENNLEMINDNTLEDFDLESNVSLENNINDSDVLENDLVSTESFEEIEPADDNISFEDLSNEDIDIALPEDEYSTSTTPSLSSIEATENDINESIEEFAEDNNYEVIDIDGNAEVEDEEEANILDLDSEHLDITTEDDDELEAYANIMADSEETTEETADIIETNQNNSTYGSDFEEEITEDNSIAEVVQEDFPEDTNYQSSDIDDLFNRNSTSDTENNDEEYATEELPKKKSKILPVIGLLAVCGALGYFGYTKFINTSGTLEDNETPLPTTVEAPIQKEKPVQNEAPIMPIETVENIKKTKPTNEGTAISIPAIEQNLGASINVANLSVKWEVPSAYISNNTANKYFTKIGKIIQLNLKTELLLLNKPPITNKIMVELEFNKNNNKFDVKKVTTSSGEQVVDNLIVKTIQNTLNINLKTNMAVFNNLPGNPVLIIRL